MGMGNPWGLWVEPFMGKGVGKDFSTHEYLNKWYTAWNHQEPKWNSPKGMRNTEPSHILPNSQIYSPI
jgi:hypothetical protein